MFFFFAKEWTLPIQWSSSVQSVPQVTVEKPFRHLSVGVCGCVWVCGRCVRVEGKRGGRGWDGRGGVVVVGGGRGGREKGVEGVDGRRGEAGWVERARRLEFIWRTRRARRNPPFFKNKIQPTFPNVNNQKNIYVYKIFGKTRKNNQKKTKQLFFNK